MWNFPFSFGLSFCVEFEFFFKRMPWTSSLQKYGKSFTASSLKPIRPESPGGPGTSWPHAASSEPWQPNTWPASLIGQRSRRCSLNVNCVLTKSFYRTFGCAQLTKQLQHPISSSSTKTRSSFFYQASPDSIPNYFTNMSSPRSPTIICLFKKRNLPWDAGTPCAAGCLNTLKSSERFPSMTSWVGGPPSSSLNTPGGWKES